MNLFEVAKLKQAAGIELTEAESAILVEDPREARQLIQQAAVQYGHAMKQGNRKLADDTFRQLAMRLEEMGYDWKRDPQVLEMQPQAVE